MGLYLDVGFAGQVAMLCQLLQWGPEPVHLLCQGAGHFHSCLQPLLHGSATPGIGDSPR